MFLYYTDRIKLRRLAIAVRKAVALRWQSSEPQPLPTISQCSHMCIKHAAEVVHALACSMWTTVGADAGNVHLLCNQMSAYIWFAPWGTRWCACREDHVQCRPWLMWDVTARGRRRNNKGVSRGSNTGTEPINLWKRSQGLTFCQQFQWYS